MPELPEVTTIVKGLNNLIVNKTIKDIIIKRNTVIKSDINFFKKSLIDNKILNITRKGKFLIFHLDNNVIMLSHLKLEGKFLYGKSIKDISRFARVIFVFNDDTILNYDDSRLFGLLLIKNENDYLNTPPLSLLGPDGNSNNIDPELIYAKSIKDNRTIKEFLLDQSIIAGLGNIYVDEVLFKTKISPLSKANCLCKNQIINIIKSSKEILDLAIKNNGSTIRTYHSVDNKEGSMQNFHKVYGREGLPCKECKTKIIKTFIKGRGTSYCPKCQKLYKKYYVVGITGAISSGKSTVLSYFKELDYKIFSSDQEVKKLYEEDGFKKLLINYFKTSDKNEIRNIVKNDKNKLKKLEELIHPIIKNRISSFIKANKKNNLAIEVPLLFETKLNILMDFNIFVFAKDNIKYLKSRGYIGQEQLILNSRINYDKNINKSNYILYNNGSLIDLKKEIIKINKGLQDHNL